jgi:LysR family transcriptional activator of nhaA
MDWLNYHHLLYFWAVVREGSIARAGERLHLSQPTISTQLHKLERSVGDKLFQKVGRKLQLTDTGRTVFRYADEIFTIGRELKDALRGRGGGGRPLRFAVGVSDVLPKLIIYRLLQPAFVLPERLQLVCREGNADELTMALAGHDLDIVLSDAPAGAGVRIKAYSHLLGDCGVGMFGTSELYKKFHRKFPASLESAPMLMPATSTSLRRSMDQWLDTNAIRPSIVAEFDDSALLKAFGREGLGLFPAPLAVRAEIEKQYGVKLIGEIPGIRERFYAISVERRLRHPAVVAISNAAKNELFG